MGLIDDITSLEDMDLSELAKALLTQDLSQLEQMIRQAGEAAGLRARAWRRPSLEVLEQRRHRSEPVLLPPDQEHLQAVDPGGRGEHAREQTGSGREAVGGLAIGLRKKDAASGEPVDVGRFVEGAAVATQPGPTKIIGKDEDDVGAMIGVGG